VNDQTDSQLLRAYVEHRAEPAFAELVRRHVDFVYSAAQRMVCDSHLAEDVTQGVFVALAKQAVQLANRPVLSGWLHGTARNIAAQTVRTDVRRRAREQEAAAMNELIAGEPEAGWEHIAPQLDAALGELGESDRDVLLLRYFERKSAQQMTQTLGISDEVAQKRVSRAVEKLREFFSKRKITIGAGGLAVLISANAVQSAPIGLAVTISAAAVLTGTVASTSAVIAATKTITMTALQKTAITVVLTAAVGAGIFEARQASQVREQNQLLQQKLAPLTEQIQQLQSERDDATNQQALLAAEIAKTKDNNLELLKLRGEVGLLREQLNRTTVTPNQTPSQIKFDLPYSQRDEWSEKGTAKPLDTLFTMLAAIKQKDENRLNQIVSRSFPSETLEQLTLPKADWDKVSAIQIVSEGEFFPVTENGPQDTAQIEAIIEEQVDNGLGEKVADQTVERWSLIKTNNQWLITGSH
jgi:RNA polymerase sigma factor (sigma-70 family)